MTVRPGSGPDRSQLPTPGATRTFPFPAIEKSTLPNGLRVWTVHHTQVPLVAFTLLIRRGAASDPAGKEGLAAVTADMLDEGSGTRSAIEIHEALARLGAGGPTDEEIERGRVQAETQFMFRLQTVGGFGGKSDQLNAYNVFLKDPAYFTKDLERYQTCTKASLTAVVNRYLDPAHRVTLSIVPHGRESLAAPDSTTAAVS